MFREMISKKCDVWYMSNECTIGEIISYIETQGKMRDAQIYAIKVYLFLKIACNNKPLSELFISGAFNNLDLEEIELKSSTRVALESNPAAAAFFEYCLMAKQCNPKIEVIEKVIREDPLSLDYNRIFNDIFYGVTYTDYVFSLPMGAGKTYLMAAFMYLDLYFSSIDPDNKAFAHNFIILAPSGLKNSIIPSLKTIKKFDPTWILEKTVAENIRREMKFETLEENSTASKSNKAKNPNARKVSMHLISGDVRGLVFVTNAEKVILDNYKDSKQMMLPGLSSDYKYAISNELRNIIGKIPNLSIFIDEVHHATDDSIKLRYVVGSWAERGSVSSVIGFSGTPYVTVRDKVTVQGKIQLINQEITNVVFYYPLIEGIGNFLKTPIIKSYENRENYMEIIDGSLRAFLNTNISKSYSSGIMSKVAIYATSIEALEEVVYPAVLKIVEQYGLNPLETILKYHDGNTKYKAPVDAAMEFATLDTDISKIRVILLVQIGKEGWDCKSLTGVILSNENKSSKNMVLQTCCRCLRQVIKYDKETAYIYLSKSNEEILSDQLKKEQNITLDEFQEGAKNKAGLIKFYNRMNIVNLPPVEFYQFQIESNIIIEPVANIDSNLRSIPLEKCYAERIILTKTFKNELIGKESENNEFGKLLFDVADFNQWISEISKGSFDFLSLKDLFVYEEILIIIFDTIIFEEDGVRYFSSKFDRSKVNSLIRQSFYAKRHVETSTEYLETYAELLAIINFVNEKQVMDVTKYYPSEDVVSGVMDIENGSAEELLLTSRIYHYIPYHLDSNFEKNTLEMLYNMSVICDSGLEVYYNGDKFLTEFHIKCYKNIGSRWSYVGRYTPDFLIIQRKDNVIFKVVIIETKGKIYATDPNFINRKKYVEDYFVKENNLRYGYEKFDYLYIEDTLSKEERFSAIHDTVKTFFEV